MTHSTPHTSLFVTNSDKVQNDILRAKASKLPQISLQTSGYFYTGKVITIDPRQVKFDFDNQQLLYEVQVRKHLFSAKRISKVVRIDLVTIDSVIATA